MYTPIEGVRCSECKANDVIAVDEDDGVSFYCIACDRRVGRLENST